MRIHRRRFLRASSLAGVALAAAPSLALESASKKYRTAIIGTGWWGMNILGEAMAAGESNVVGLCDVDASALERARQITDRRNAAVLACDCDAFLELWADDCIVEGPEHYLEGKEQLGAAMQAGWAAMKPIQMVTRSLAVEGDAMYYEFAVVWELRSSGQRLLFTGMTYHQVDARGRLRLCREYFDPPGKPRRTAHTTRRPGRPVGEYTGEEKKSRPEGRRSKGRQCKTAVATISDWCIMLYRKQGTDSLSVVSQSY